MAFPRILGISGGPRRLPGNSLDVPRSYSRLNKYCKKIHELIGTNQNLYRFISFFPSRFPEGVPVQIMQIPS